MEVIFAEFKLVDVQIIVAHIATPGDHIYTRTRTYAGAELCGHIGVSKSLNFDKIYTDQLLASILGDRQLVELIQ